MSGHITPEDRQEVAAKLRENSTAHTADEALQIICKCTVRAMRGSKSVMEVLADLIDHPTCEYLPCAHAIWYDDDGEEHEDTKLEALGTSEDTYCSVCGYEMVAGDDGWFDYERKEHGSRLIPLFDYCPNCGSKVVVSEDE